MTKLTVFGCMVAVMAQGPLAQPGRGTQPVTVQLPTAPALTVTPVLEIRADQVKGKSSPILYGLMTEEINYSYDGGLYAEQVRNRNFKEPQSRGRRRGEPAVTNNTIPYWTLVQSGGASGSMELDTTQPLNEALTNSLKLTVASVGANQRVGISNEGFWGMAVRPNTRYRATLWAKGGSGFTGPLTLALVSRDGNTVFASTQIGKTTDSYQKYQATLTTGAGVPTTKGACFQIWAGGKGTVWFSLVSLFPPTFKNRLNGLRPDIMQLFVDMKAKFLRFPGGNYLEGSTLANRWNWKATIGDISERPGHMSPWGYWSSDGLGLLGYLEWCEDIGMEPVMGIYSGYSLDRRPIPAGEALEPYVQNALDQIEYTIGDASTTWGARRIRDGHPAPFKLTYVEIGNEEIPGRFGYEARYVQFRDAIRARYPNLKVISSVAEAPKIGDTIPDVQDDHHYMSPPGMLGMWNKYDSYDRRSSPPLLLGEWGTGMRNSGANPLTPNLEYGLCDGTAAIQFERNSDLILMQCYAPLFVNANPGGSQWVPNLIGYDVLNCYGGVSYHVLKIFSNNYGDTILTADVRDMPTWEVPMRGPRISPTDPRMRTVPRFYYNATRDSTSGIIYLKVVNPVETPLPLHVKITGVSSVEPSGTIAEVKGTDPLELNTITDREKIVPTTARADGLGTDFTRTFPAYSASVLMLKAKQ